jgi:pimeloyl-ACP methyl ester carboxylesterase
MRDPAVETVSSFLRLTSGRRVGYAEWGQPGGATVIHMHGMPGSRIERQADPSFYARLGVRLITPDRPGYGLSDPNPAGTLLDWANDVAELADRLEIPRFGVTALSGGGIYALALARRFPERLTGVGVTGCPSPLAGRGTLEGMRIMNQLGIRTVQVAPWLLEGGARALSNLLRRHPQFFIELMNRDKSRPDRELLARPSVRTAAIDTLREAIHHGTGGYVQDVKLLASPWGFSPADIVAPVSIWHGDLDTVIPLRHAYRLAEEIPNVRLRICPGEAHMLMWNHLGEILVEATGRKPATITGAAVT